MKVLSPVLALLLALLAAAGMRGFFVPDLHHAYVVVDTPEAITLRILQKGRENAAQCAQAVATLATATQGSCAACRIRQSACLSELDEFQARMLSTAPLPMVSARINNGAIAYETERHELALETCRQSERYAETQSAAAAMVCHAPDFSRSLPAADQSRAVKNQSVYRSFLIGLATFAILIAALLTGARLRATSFRRKHVPSSVEGPESNAQEKHLWIPKLTLAGTDLGVLLTAFALIGFPPSENSTAWAAYDLNNLWVHLLLSLIAVGWFWMALEHYARRRPFWDELREILRTLGFMFLLAAAAVLYARLDAQRGLHLWLWIAAFALLPLSRVAARAVLDELGLWRYPAVIVGTGENAQDAYRAIKSEDGMGYAIRAFIQPLPVGEVERLAPGEGGASSSFWRTPESSSLAINGDQIPVLHPQTSIAVLLQELGHPQVILALDSLNSAEAQSLLQRLTASENNIHVIPTIRGLPLFGTQLSHFFSHEVLFLTVRNNLSRRGYQWAKRIFDLAGASLLLILLAPLLLGLSWLIRRSGGPAIYVSPRLGAGGRQFKCLKFRSMRPDADSVLKQLLETDPSVREQWTKEFKIKNDPRITPIGNFLRKTSLDELPQLINVLRGEMSLVGPRPMLEEEPKQYGESLGIYFSMRPGMTGLWQISGRSDTGYGERIQLNAWYAQNWSLWYDIAILFKTIGVVLRSRGAY